MCTHSPALSVMSRVMSRVVGEEFTHEIPNGGNQGNKNRGGLP